MIAMCGLDMKFPIPGTAYHINDQLCLVYGNGELVDVPIIMQGAGGYVQIDTTTPKTEDAIIVEKQSC